MKMTEIKLLKRYPASKTEDIIDAYMRGWNDAIEAAQFSKFQIADEPDDYRSYGKRKEEWQED